MIGSCALPLPLQQRMPQYPLVWLEDRLAGRVERILGDYVVDLCAEFVALLGDEAGFTAFAERLRLCLRNIVKRLGWERYLRLSAIIAGSLAEPQRSGALDLHPTLSAMLLVKNHNPISP